MKTLTVDAKALRDVLIALNESEHYIKELVVIDELPGDEGSISKLTRQYNEAIELYKANTKNT